MASPVVAGVAGLILTFIPTLTTEELRDRIINSANPTIYAPDSAQGVNGTWYYPKLATGDRIPMLGSGVVDTVAAIKGELHPVPTSTATARVSPGCSQIKVAHQIDKSLLILLLMPVFTLIPRKSS
jgi:subtilisin family serine protease